MKLNNVLESFLFSLYLLQIKCSFFGKCARVSSNPSNTNEKDISKLGSSLLLLYDVDNVILKHTGLGKTLINPEILPLLATMDKLYKSKDSRIFLPRIFSHGCETATKLSEIKSTKPHIVNQDYLNDNHGEIYPFSIKIKDIGEAYLYNGVYFLKKEQLPNNVRHPLDLLEIFFADENESQSNMSLIIPFNRITERKSIYSDALTSSLTNEENIFFRNYAQKARKSINNKIICNNTLLSNADEEREKKYLKNLLSKVSTLPKVWPYNIRSEELPFVKDLAKYRTFIKSQIRLGTTIILLDDLAIHFNFACTHEHFTEEYKVFIVIIKKFMPDNDSENTSYEFQRSIPVPIGATKYVPFDLREVQNKISRILDKFPEKTHPNVFYRKIRDEFIKNSPTYPKCGYDVSKPSPFYFLIIIECDILHNLIRLFIDDRMAEEVTLLLNISSFIAVLSGKKSCEHVFSMVRHLISSGFYQWANKVLPLTNIKSASIENLYSDFSPPFSQFSKKNASNVGAIPISEDKHIFMSKLYSRMPRSRTMVLRLDFHGDPGKIQHSDYTCFLNAPPNPKNSSTYPSKSTKYRQDLNLQADSKLSKFFGLPIYGEMKTITLLQRLTIIFNKIEGILESTKKASRATPETETDANFPIYITQDEDDYVGAVEEIATLEQHSLLQIAASSGASPHSGHATSAPPTIYPQVSYSFLSIFYTVVETLKGEFPKDYISCIGSIN